MSTANAVHPLQGKTIADVLNDLKHQAKSDEITEFQTEIGIAERLLEKNDDPLLFECLQKLLVAKIRELKEFAERADTLEQAQAFIDKVMIARAFLINLEPKTEG